MVLSLFPSKKFNQPKTLALDRISSSMLHSCLEHLLVTHFVLPVTDVWQFDPWWIPKLGDQPTLGLSPKFLLLSSPLNRFVSCGVRQSIQFIFSDKTNFCSSTKLNPIRLCGTCLLAGCKYFSSDANPGKKASSPVAFVTRISEW